MDRKINIKRILGFILFLALIGFIRNPTRLKHLFDEILTRSDKHTIQRGTSHTTRYDAFKARSRIVEESPEEILRKLPKTIGAFVAENELNFYPYTELGVSLGYNTPDNIAVTIYIYDLKEKSIPDGIDSKIINYAYKQALDEIKHFENVGVYQNVKTIYNEPTDIGSVRFLCAILSYDMKGKSELKIQTARSEIYMTGKRNHIVKIRVTYPIEQRNYVRPQIDELLGSIFYFF